jgi:hypothetical protein
LNPCLYCVYGMASLRSLITAAAGNPVTPHTWFTIGDPRKACGPIMNPGKAWGIRPGKDWGYAFITAKSEHLHRCEPSLKAPMDQGGFCGRVSSVRKRRVMLVYPDMSSCVEQGTSGVIVQAQLWQWPGSEPARCRVRLRTHDRRVCAPLSTMRLRRTRRYVPAASVVVIGTTLPGNPGRAATTKPNCRAVRHLGSQKQSPYQKVESATSLGCHQSR